jgi:hypothetical protein
MSEAYRLPRSELSHETAELEIFALNHLQKLIPELIDPEWDRGPFVLSHSDLRSTNIIIDDDFNICSIIDWEWAFTVPRQFFMPPPWITGQDLGYTPGADSHATFLEFHEVLQAKASSSSICRQLADEWDSDLLNALILPLGQILQHHSSLIRVYYKFIFPRYFQKSRIEVVTEFFQGGGKKSRNHALEVQQRITDSARYTQYLKDNGLFIPDEETRMAREWLKKAQELDKMLGKETPALGE